MNSKIILFLFVLFTFANCKTPGLIFSNNDLNSNTALYEVSGRQGWQFNQIIKYGSFSTSKSKRSWDLGYNIKFIVTFQACSEKLSFTQYLPDHNSMEVLAVSEFNDQSINIAKDFFKLELPVDFGLSLEYKNTFAGTIFDPKNPSNNASFIVYNVDNSWGDRSSGFLTLSNGDVYDIKGVKKVAGQANLFGIDVVGFEIKFKGQTLAGVSLLNNGRVWLKNDLTNEQLGYISGLFTSLLLRQNQTERFS